MSLFDNDARKEWTLCPEKDKKGKKKKEKDKKKEKGGKKKDKKNKNTDKQPKGKKENLTFKGFAKPERPNVQKPLNRPNLALDYKEAFEFDKSNAFEVKYGNDKLSGVFIKVNKSNMIRLSDSANLMDIVKNKAGEISTAQIKEGLKFLPIKLGITKPLDHFKKLKED